MAILLFALNTTDTNTTGRLKLTFIVPSALTFWHDYMVVPADVYANNITANYLYNAVADQVWNEAISGHTTAGSAGDYLIDIEAYTDDIPTLNTKLDTIDNYVDTEVAAILVDTGTTIPGTIATVDANVDAILVDTGTTLPAQLTAIDDYIDTEVSAILEDTGTTIPGTITTIDNKLATVDANVDAILVDTGTTIPAQLTVIDDYVDTEVAAILVDTGTTLPDSINNISTSLNQTDKNLIIAGNDIIPASGMTLPKFTYSREGDASRLLIARGLSYSANQPSVLFRLVDGSGTEVTHAMEDSFTWATFAMQAPDITGATPYAHLFKWQISDSVPNGWYQMYTVVESNSRAIGTVNTIILSPTPTIDESGLVPRSIFSEFVSDVSQSFRSIRQGTSIGIHGLPQQHGINQVNTQRFQSFVTSRRRWFALWLAVKVLRSI